MSKRPTVEQLMLRQDALKRAYTNVFSTAEGKMVLEDLNERFYDVELFVQGQPESTIFNTGMREVVRHLRIMSETTTTEED